MDIKNTENKNIHTQFNILLKKIKIDLNNSKNKNEEQINLFRISAIKKVLDIIKNYPNKINKGSDLKHIKGIGKSTVSRIDEIIDTGKLKELDGVDLQDKHSEYITELQKVFGIGRKKAIELVKKYNITNIQELKNNINKLDLPHAIKIGLKYYDKFQKNIPRSEMDTINDFILNKIKNIDKDIIAKICGSYRREKTTSNDIDLLIVHPDYNTKKDLQNRFKTDPKNHLLTRVVKLLINKNFIIASLTGEEVKSKYMGYCKIKNKPIRRIDIRFMPYESYYYALLYFTGSADFNKRMRSLAIDLGYTLNEYGLFKKNKFIRADSEKEIFDILNMEYIEPKYR